MIKISDFNSLWEIAFAVNAIFVYFELIPMLERKFCGTNAIGQSIIDKMVEKQDRRYINIYGWRTVLFAYADWISWLKIISVFNSLAAILLIIIAGFFPESTLNAFYITIIILILFTPVISIPAIILLRFPVYKLRCIEEAVQNILERNDGDISAQASKSRRYRIAVEYIKMTEFYFSPFVKRNKDFTDREILDEVGE